jgi:DNA repair exonuclease SbcCD nuclease subunit
MTRAFLTPEASARFSQARIDAIAKLGEIAAERDAAFIIVAGDVFESNQVSRETLVRTLDALNALPVPVVLLPGNHDPLDGASIYSTPEFRKAADHVIVLRDREAIAVAEGVEVVGAPWKTKHPSTDLCAELAAGLEPASGGTVRIAVCHGQVDTLSPDTSRPEIINLAAAEQAIEEGKFHYLGLGDRHSVTEVGTTGRIWYSGAPVATDFDEVDPNKALLVELEPSSGDCTVEPVTVGDWHFVAEKFPLNGQEDLDRYSAWLDELPAKQRTAIKVGFEGSINLATAAALDDVFESKADLFASLRRRERTTDLAIVPDELDHDSVSLSGYAKQTYDELLEQSTGGDAVAEDALRLLYRLSRQEAR